MQGPPLPVKGCKIFDLRSVYKFKAIDHRSSVFVVSSEGPRPFSCILSIGTIAAYKICSELS